MNKINIIDETKKENKVLIFYELLKNEIETNINIQEQIINEIKNNNHAKVINITHIFESLFKSNNISYWQTFEVKQFSHKIKNKNPNLYNSLVYSRSNTIYNNNSFKGTVGYVEDYKIYIDINPNNCVCL